MKEKSANAKKIIRQQPFFNPFFTFSTLYDKQRHIEQVKKEEQFNGLSQLWQLPVIEGILIIGIEQKMWKNRRQMFFTLRDAGSRVTYQSYYKFCAGQFRYLNSEIITIGLYLCATDIVTAHQRGYDQAQKILKRYK